MITLKEAFKLLRIEDMEIAWLCDNEKQEQYYCRLPITGKDVRKKYDMRNTMVTAIVQHGYFEFDGFEFVIKKASRPMENRARIDRAAEFRYLLAYSGESCFDDEICRDRLRMLWTAYCLHHNLDVDTSGYDNDLMDLWNKLAETGDGTSDWEDYDGFENFMCAYLV